MCSIPFSSRNFGSPQVGAKDNQVLTYKPSANEELYYDFIFRTANVSLGALVPAGEAMWFFSSSLLPNSVMMIIYEIINSTSPVEDGFDRTKFYVVVRLIQLFQNKHQINNFELKADEGRILNHAFFKGISEMSVHFHHPETQKIQANVFEKLEELRNGCKPETQKIQTSQPASDAKLLYSSVRLESISAETIDECKRSHGKSLSDSDLGKFSILSENELRRENNNEEVTFNPEQAIENLLESWNLKPPEVVSEYRKLKEGDTQINSTSQDFIVSLEDEMSQVDDSSLGSNRGEFLERFRDKFQPEERIAKKTWFSGGEKIVSWLNNEDTGVWCGVRKLLQLNEKKESNLITLDEDKLLIYMTSNTDVSNCQKILPTRDDQCPMEGSYEISNVDNILTLQEVFSSALSVEPPPRMSIVVADT